jgi:glyoxylase-like metal-dependent hydrolase (beta-lactamase superfamily II)
MRAHGLPGADAEHLRADAKRLARVVRFAADPLPLEPGDDVEGWEVLHLPGHADGHLALLRHGTLIAGDALLATITPNVGLYPEARQDPLGDYLASLEYIIALAPRVAYGGHGETIDDPPARARELIAHHRDRLARTHAALSSAPRNAYDVSLELFPEPLPVVLRRFALAETRAHLEYLARRGEIARDGDASAAGYVRAT